MNKVIYSAFNAEKGNFGTNNLKKLDIWEKKLGNNNPVYKTAKETLMYAAAKVLQSCPTLCDPIDGSPPGSPVPGILQARTLEWVAISFSNA